MLLLCYLDYKLRYKRSLAQQAGSPVNPRLESGLRRKCLELAENADLLCLTKVKA